MNILLAALVLALPLAVAGSLEIGKQIQIKHGDEQRLVNVVLPASFESNPEREFAVVILLDGGVRQWLLDAASAFARTARRGQSEEIVLVGVDTTGHRRRDLTPPMRPALIYDDEHRGGGGAADFRSWLADKVIPVVSNHYRGDGRVFLVGHSLGGLFAIDTLVTDGLSVDGVAAISPALWWDEDALLERATSELPLRNDLPPIFLARAEEDPDLMHSVAMLRGALGEHDGLCFEDRPSQSHRTILPSVLLQVGPCLWPAREPR